MLSFLYFQVLFHAFNHRSLAHQHPVHSPRTHPHWLRDLLLNLLIAAVAVPVLVLLLSLHLRRVTPAKVIKAPSQVEMIGVAKHARD